MCNHEIKVEKNTRKIIAIGNGAIRNIKSWRTSVQKLTQPDSLSLSLTPLCLRKASTTVSWKGVRGAYTRGGFPFKSSPPQSSSLAVDMTRGRRKLFLCKWAVHVGGLLESEKEDKDERIGGIAPSPPKSPKDRMGLMWFLYGWTGFEWLPSESHMDFSGLCWFWAWGRRWSRRSGVGITFIQKGISKARKRIPELNFYCRILKLWSIYHVGIEKS